MASALATGWSWLRAPAVELSFAVRAALRWTRGPARLRDEAKHELFAHLPAPAAADAAATAAELVRRFDLGALAACSTRTTFAASLAHLAALERLLPPLRTLPCGGDGVLRAADVGCGDFHYATALQRWLRRRGEPATRAVHLLGVERDGHGIHRDGHSRADHARAHAALAAPPGGDRVAFTVGDFARLALPPQDVVTMFFPFVTAHASLRWGYPVSRLAPARLFARATQALRPGGLLVVVNQTAAEFVRVRTLLGRGPVAMRCIGRTRWTSELVPWGERTRGQVGSLWRRCDAASLGAGSGPTGPAAETAPQRRAGSAPGR